MNPKAQRELGNDSMGELGTKGDKLQRILYLDLVIHIKGELSITNCIHKFVSEKE